jgi:probable F420-dependent oxidoreductase
MKFGLAFANIGPFAGAEGARAMGQGAEAAGFDSLWTVEHVLVPVGYQSTYPYDPSGKMPAPDTMDLPDPLIWLTYVAAFTESIKLATGILIVPQRNPAITAKECATLDQLSGGRLVLGVGAGWLEEEFDALDVPFADRGKRLDEYVAVMRALWADGATDFDGEFVTYPEVVSAPKPVHGTIPIVVGGHSKAAARRAGRLADGFFPAGDADPAAIAALIEVMRQSAEDAGRDPDAIEVTMPGNAALGPDALERLGELEAMGVSRVMMPPLSFDPAGIGDALAAFGDNVISKAG